MTKLEAQKKQYKKALDKFDEIISIEKTDIIRDSAIKRFEIILDLSWKTLKNYIEEKKGIICASPKDCFREAYKQGLLNYIVISILNSSGKMGLFCGLILPGINLLSLLYFAAFGLFSTFDLAFQSP